MPGYVSEESGTFEVHCSEPDCAGWWGGEFANWDDAEEEMEDHDIEDEHHYAQTGS